MLCGPRNLRAWSQGFVLCHLMKIRHMRNELSFCHHLWYCMSILHVLWLTNYMNWDQYWSSCSNSACCQPLQLSCLISFPCVSFEKTYWYTPPVAISGDFCLGIQWLKLIWCWVGQLIFVECRHMWVRLSTQSGPSALWLLFGLLLSLVPTLRRPVPLSLRHRHWPSPAMKHTELDSLTTVNRKLVKEFVCFIVHCYFLPTPSFYVGIRTKCLVLVQKRRWFFCKKYHERSAKKTNNSEPKVGLP